MDEPTQRLTWQAPRTALAAEREAPESAAPRTAVLVCHGMGKQLRFEALDTLVSILTKETLHRWKTRPEVKFGQVKLDNEWIPRAEVTLTNDRGISREVHLFEAYWAPLTAGKVTARDVTRFLFTAAWQGIRNSLSEQFDRWMFGKQQRFRYPLSTLLGIIGAFLLICAIWGLYAVLITSAVGFLTHLYHATGFADGRPFLEALATLQERLDGQAALWIVVLLIAWGLQTLYIEYIGDVAAYVSAHDVSKFSDIRRAIQDNVCRVAKVVYQTPKAGEPVYDQVVVVAHSLGSLVAYDALNRLMNDELAESGSTTIAERTKLFLSFGSPLDKTAFIFRIQKKNSTVREAFASAKQPMIVDYAFRPRQWINLHSPMDPISGRLDFYDPPRKSRTPGPQEVNNRRDPRAWIPFLAHNQYWHNPLLRQILLDELTP